MSLATLKDIFLQGKHPKANGPKRALKVIAPELKVQLGDGAIVLPPLTGRRVGCAGCANQGGTLIKVGDAYLHKGCSPKKVKP